MSEIRALIEKLVMAGVDPIEAAEVIARAAIHGAATAPKGKTAGAIRQERYRRNKASQVTESDGGADLPSPEGSSPTPPSPKPLPSNPPSPPKGGSSPTDFERFWSLFPNRVGKGAAVKAFASALKRAPLEAILLGVERYAAKTDDRPWCNPSTFLNQDRWADEPAPRPPSTASPPAERSVSDVLADISAGNWPLREPTHEPDYIETSFVRRN